MNKQDECYILSFLISLLHLPSPLHILFSLTLPFRDTEGEKIGKKELKQWWSGPKPPWLKTIPSIKVSRENKHTNLLRGALMRLIASTPYGQTHTQEVPDYFICTCSRERADTWLLTTEEINMKNCVQCSPKALLISDLSRAHLHLSSRQWVSPA